MTLRTVTFNPELYKLVPVEATVEIVHDLHYFRSEPDGTAYLPFWKHLVDCVPDSLPGVIEYKGEPDYSNPPSDNKVWNALMWMYRRMKPTYGRLPFVEDAIALSKVAQTVERQELSDDATLLNAYKTLIHTHHQEPDGSEFGFCHVKFNSNGQIAFCLWAVHAEVEAAVRAIIDKDRGQA